MRTHAIALALSLGFLSSAARAADFTFTVPVRIENMPNITEAWVNCFVTGETSAGLRQIGFGRSDVALATGSFAGNVTVEVNASPGFASNEASSWGCSLAYNWRMPDGSIFTRSTSSSAERATLYTQYTGQDVTASHADESGTISR